MGIEGGGEEREGSYRLRVAALIAELAEKIEKAGISGVHILTEDEYQKDRLKWFREGWAEHGLSASAAYADHRSGQAGGASSHPVDPPPGLLIPFPARAGEPADAHPLPIVRAKDASDAKDSELMPHRRRGRAGSGRPASSRRPSPDIGRGRPEREGPD